MVKSKPAIIIFFVFIISILVFFLFFQSEERKIRKRFKMLAQTASKSAADSQLIVAAKSKKISKFFAQPCHIEATEYNISKKYSQDNIRMIAYQILSRNVEYDLKFIDLKIGLTEPGIATAVSTVRIIGKAKGEEEIFEENHEIQCRLNKIDDEWVFWRIDLVDVLEK